MNRSRHQFLEYNPVQQFSNHHIPHEVPKIHTYSGLRVFCVSSMVKAASSLTRSRWILALCLVLLMTIASGMPYECNLCGCENCTMGTPEGVVKFVYMNETEKRPCMLLQQDVENPTIYNRAYCHDVLWRQTYDVCGCYHNDHPRLLLKDIPGTYESSSAKSYYYHTRANKEFTS